MKERLKLPAFIYSLPLILAVLFFIVKATTAPYSDFAGYYFGSKELLNGNYLNVYDTYKLNLLIQQQGYNNIFVSYTPFTPFASVIFSPLLFLKVGAAKLVFNIISCGLFLLSVHRIKNHLQLHNNILLILAIVFIIPLKNNLLFGQAYLILFSLLIEGYIAFAKKKFVLSSLFWSIAILFKVFPAFIIIFLLLKKEYKATLILASFCVALLLLSIAINRYDTWLFYIQLLPRLNNGELNDSFTYAFQSFYMLAKDCFVYDKLLNPHPVANSQPAFVVAAVLWKALLLSIAIIASFKKDITEFAKFGVWIFVTLLISPNGSSYSLVLLAIPILSFFTFGSRSINMLLYIGLMFLACSVSTHWVADLPTLLKFPRLYLLAGVFILMIVTMKVKLNLKIFFVMLALFIAIDAFQLSQPKKEASQYFLSQEKHLLITQLYVDNNQLFYKYWSAEGEKIESTNQTVNSYQPLELKNDQIIFNGKTITHSKDWKRCPLLINNDHVIYLSDQNRGIGFFTIRKIQLR